MTTPIRLITFLGTGPKDTGYSAADYTWNGEPACRSRFVAEAVTRALHPRLVDVIATEQALEQHGDDLMKAFRDGGLPTPQIHLVQLSSDPKQFENALWTQFDILKGLLRADDQPEGRIVLDITHGFRHQPFFAAAAVAFVQSVNREARDVQVVYGEYQKLPAPSPILDLSPFSDLLAWSHALMMFLRTGNSDDLAPLATDEGKAQMRAYNAALNAGGKLVEPSERFPATAIGRLGQSLQAFGDNLVTARTGALLLPSKSPGSVSELVQTLEAAKPLIKETMPPLSDVLDELQALAMGLTTTSLRGEAGERALANLAKFYLSRGRFGEAAATVRESLITRLATCDEEANPGQGFDETARSKLDRQFGALARDTGKRVARADMTDEHNEVTFSFVTKVRNDIEHAGFNASPGKALKLKQSVGKLVHVLAETVGEPIAVFTAEAAKQPPAPGGIFANISNHPWTTWGEAQRQAAMQLAESVEDFPFPEVDPDLDEAGLDDLAQAFLQGLSAGIQHAMIMGEFNLTLRLVTALQAKGVTCWATTGKRQTTMDGDLKTSRFEFVRFRRYADNSGPPVIAGGEM